MHTGTGEIKNFSVDEILEMPVKERKNWVKLEPEIYDILIKMNREGRRAYYKKHRKAFQGLSWQDINGSLKGGE